MAVKKSQLYSSLWASCDKLRGGMDASQYKDYILTLLFVKYVSDKYKDDPYGAIAIPQGASFEDLVALKGNKNIGEEIDKLIAKLATKAMKSQNVDPTVYKFISRMISAFVKLIFILTALSM